MIEWRPGMACLVDGEWPAEIAGRPTRTFAPVAFLGLGPDDALDANIPLGRLVRPPGGPQLDRKHGATKGQWRQKWTAPELRRLRAIWPFNTPEQTVFELRRQFGTKRSANGCKIALQRWWGTSHRGRQDQVLTMRRTCELLGLGDHHTFEKLVEKGLLLAEKSAVRAGKSHRWAVRADEIRRFVLSHPEHYDPRRMPPSPYRTLGEQVHAEDPILTVREAAKESGWHHHTLTRVIREGRLRATWGGLGIGTGNGCWLIRRSALADLVDLRGVVAERRARALRAWLAARGLKTVADRAAELGVYDTTLQRWIREEGYPAVRVRVGRRFVYGVKPIPTFRASTAAADDAAA